jgi:hypothetical protein
MYKHIYLILHNIHVYIIMYIISYYIHINYYKLIIDAGYRCILCANAGTWRPEIC